MLQNSVKVSYFSFSFKMKALEKGCVKEWLYNLDILRNSSFGNVIDKLKSEFLIRHAKCAIS